MDTKYVCPKCGSTDVYFAKKQIITGIGGIWGNRQKEVERPFCRQCDIEAKETTFDQKGREVSDSKQVLVVFGAFVALVAIWFAFVQPLI